MEPEEKRRYKGKSQGREEKERNKSQKECGEERGSCQDIPDIHVPSLPVGCILVLAAVSSVHRLFTVGHMYGCFLLSLKHSLAMDVARVGILP